MHDLKEYFTRQEKLVAALRDPLRYPHAVDTVLVIETHISWVLLAGDFAYKIKKAVALGFLDYSTLEFRRSNCDEEVRLNRRTAPDLYLDTVVLGGTPDDPRFGTLPAIEYAVRMRRFPAGALMDVRLEQGSISARHIDNLAAAITRFHARLPTVQAGAPFGTAASVHAAAMQNFEQLRVLLGDKSNRNTIVELESATEAEYLECRTNFISRHAHGFVRECHGDLHLGNIVLMGDEPVPFDCIEFNPALRWIDVMDEIAFAVMDLLHRDQHEYAWRLLNACLEYSGDYAGIPVLRFYLAYRATVRAKVSAIRMAQPDISRRDRSAAQGACSSYLALAQACLAYCRPFLLITHGLPGSGKTTFAQLALQKMGAIRIRSDVERKRLFGLDMLESSRNSAADIYSAESTRRTYARLLENAREILLAGFPVIVDAAFLRQDEREEFSQLAHSMSLPFAIASLLTDDSILRERIRTRRNDASEADAAVLDMLQARQQPLFPRELEVSAIFSTAEAPDSAGNRQSWQRLSRLLASGFCGCQLSERCSN